MSYKLYEQYGIGRDLVELVKARMKQPHLKDQVTAVLDGVTKADLQNRVKIRSLMHRVAQILGVSLSDAQTNAIVKFVIDQKIDPKNTFHLLRLWGMFR